MTRKHGIRRGNGDAATSARDAATSGDAAPGADPRRARRRRAALAGLAVLLAGVALLAAYRLLGPARRPNVVLVSIDTLRADRLPVYGYRKTDTPAIDALAREGVVFESCYTHVPLTLPAHTSLFTGLLPPVHGVRNNAGFRLQEGTRTLALELREAGYSTGAAVSAFVLHSKTGISRGFDWYDDDLHAASPGESELEIQRDGSETVDRALVWLSRETGDRKRKGPFFLFVHLFEPHTPYTPPQRFLVGGRAPYDGEVMYADELVGKLFAGLRRMGLYDESLIVLLSDHGEALGEHGEEDHGVFLYRGVMRVPLVVRLPRALGGGRRVPEPVQLVDVSPTILERTGLSPREGGAGRSLMPGLLGAGLPADRRVYAESLYGRLHFGWKELYSLTTARHSFILAPRQELYDVVEDPGQLRNLLEPGSGPEAAAGAPSAAVTREHASLHRALRSYVGNARVNAPDPVDEEETEKLRALGYLASSASATETDEAAPDPKDRIGDLAKFRQASRLKKAHRYGQAAGLMVEVVKASPRMLDAWEELSGLRLRLGDAEGAAGALRESLKVAPRRAAPRFALVELLVQQGRFDEARRELEVAAFRQPDEAETWRAYLEVLERRPAGARAAAARAARGLPAAVPFVEGLLAYGGDEYAKAAPLFRKALAELGGRSSSVLPYVHLYLGDSLSRGVVATPPGTGPAGLVREANEELRKELALRPSNAAAATSLALLHATARDAQQLRAVLDGFARENPSVATWDLVAGLYRRIGLVPDADRWAARARAGVAP